MKKLFKILTIGLVLSVIAGCSSAKPATEKAQKIVMYLPGDPAPNHDQIMESVNKITKEEIGAELDLRFIGWGEFVTKTNLWLSTGSDEFDIVTTGGLGGDNFVLNAQKGALADLTELAKTHAPDALKALDEAYIAGNTFDDKLYGMAVNANVYGETVIAVNGDLLEKHNLSVDGITTYAGLEEVLTVIKEKEPQVTPFYVKNVTKVVAGLDYPLSDNMPFAIDLQGDENKIVNAYDNPRLVENLKAVRGLYEKGLINVDTSIEFPGWETDVWFAHQTETGPSDYEEYVLENASGKNIELVRIAEPLKDQAHAQMASLVIPKNSKNQEKAMEFINLLFTNKDLMTTLAYGIEGENWNKIEGDRLRLTDNFDTTKRYSPWNYGDKMNLYLDEAISEETIKIVEEKLKTAKVSPLIGFTVNIDDIKTEIANIQAVMEKYRPSIHSGTVDVDSAIENMNKELEEAGYSKVQEEIQKQFDAFRQ